MPIKDTLDYKVVTTDGYNMLFDKRDGTMLRWGDTVESDPQVAPLGPELLDIEISVNSCLRKRCHFCYKASGYDEEKHMDLETFKRIIGKFSIDTIVIEFENGQKARVSPNQCVTLASGLRVAASQLKGDEDLIDW